MLALLFFLLPAEGYLTHDVYLSGRVSGTSFDWPAVKLLARFASSSCFVRLSDTGGNRFTIYLDGAFHSFFQSKKGSHEYFVFSGMSFQPRDVVIVKITEACTAVYGCTWADFGVTTFEGLLLDPNATMLEPALPWIPTRRLEIIGDSITCGWGAEGGDDDLSCSAGENATASWGSLVAERLQAEHHNIAWGGIGIVLNDHANVRPQKATMPALWKRAIANDPSSQWNVHRYSPSAVLIHLGTNDFTPGHNLSRERFRYGYLNFLGSLAIAYPGVQFFLACGPMGTLGDPRGPYFPCSLVKDIASEATETVSPTHFLNFSGIFLDRHGRGGCGHPSAKGHFAMAEIAEPIIRKILGWSSSMVV